MIFAILLLINPVTISFNVEVGRADKAVTALADASGLTMKVLEPVASEVVFLNVKDLTVDEVMSSLARVTAARWEKKEDGAYVLSRPSDLVALEKSKRIDFKLKTLNACRSDLLMWAKVPFDETTLTKLIREKSALEGLRGDDAVTEAQSESYWAREQQLFLCDPVNRALARCVQNIDLRQIASLSPGETIVYAFNPNRVQKQLPQSAEQALQCLLPEQAIWGRALKLKPLGIDEDPETRFSTDHTIKFFEEDGDESDFSIEAEPWGRTVPFTKQPANILLIATGSGDNFYKIEMKMYDEQGKLMLKFGVGDYYREEEPQPDEETPPEPKPSPLTLDLWHRMQNSGEIVKASLEKLRPFFDAPINNDPLWLGNQETLTVFATFKKKSVIACLPDEARVDFEETLNFQRILQYSKMKVTESSSLVELRPSNFIAHWQDRFDRNKMADCVKVFRQNGKIDLLTYVRFAAGLGDNADRSLGGLFVQLIDPDFRSAYGAFDLGYGQYAELLAILSPEQIIRLRKGETLPYQGLTTDQRALAAKIVYASGPTLAADGVRKFADPTFELPNGILGGSGVTATFGSDRIVEFHSGTAGRRDVFYSVNLSKDDDGARGWSGPAPRVPPGGMAFASYTIHTQEHITLQCGLAPGHFVSGHLSEPHSKPTFKPVPFAKLPEDIQKKIGGAVKFLDSFKDFVGGAGDPPPPRK